MNEVTPPQVDLEHPWLGLESFSEKTRGYFFGRDAEVAELLQHLKLNPLLVFFGRSGLGKTSLLRARLVPDLEKGGARPIFCRIGYRESEETPIEQLLTALNASSSFNVPGLVLPENSDCRLWFHFHRRDAKDRFTHLILDQFEEVFTVGAERPGAEGQVRQALAILTQGAIPPAVEALLDEGEAFSKYFTLDVAPLPIVLSIRQDYFFALNRWRNYLPQVCQNNFELRALRGPAALDAVFKPGELRSHYRGEVAEENKAETGLPPIVSKETAERIVRFVAKKAQDVPMDEIEAVPPILSLLCRELNEARFNPPLGTANNPAQQIAFSETDTDIETIIKTFYERCVSTPPEAVRMFIEEELVSYSGARLAQDEKSVLSCFEKGWQTPGADGRLVPGFGDARKARACLSDLVNQRLLTSVGGGDNPSYELIHDLLATVVERSRTARAGRLEKEQADRRARAASRRARFIAAALGLVVLAAAFLFQEYRRANAAAIKAETAAKEEARLRDEGEKLIEFLAFEFRDKLQDISRIDLLSAVNERVMAYYESVPLMGENDATVLDHRAAAHLNLAQVAQAQGFPDKALILSQRSLELYNKMEQKAPGNPTTQFNLAAAHSGIGVAWESQGSIADGLASYQTARELLLKLTQTSDDPGFYSALGASYTRVGTIAAKRAEWINARENYDKALAHFTSLMESEPKNPVRVRRVAIVKRNIAVILRQQQRFDEALKACKESIELLEPGLLNTSDQLEYRHHWGHGQEELGVILLGKRDWRGASEAFERSTSAFQDLIKYDATNFAWQTDLAALYCRQSQTAYLSGDFEKARHFATLALDKAKPFPDEHPAVVGVKSELALCYLRLGLSLAKSGPKSPSEAREKIERARDIYQDLQSSKGLSFSDRQDFDEVELALRELGSRDKAISPP